MSQFKPCAGKTACRDDNVNCLVCGRSLQAIEATRKLIDGLTELAMAEDYDNVDEFAAYVAAKVVKKVRHRREGSTSTD
ncbi:hypothetical protein EZJ19_09500 [Parasulfuritortus cantonensis]|uniref:DUF1289 domain-containing protein n=1 Tax=Parasulfuritortus cantonensis TaxID=2528202 RepID=A0A4R1BCA3_9PROT|nr:hypothetical protein [Parasulfuritortus cantonensis]TCJ14671.1 hypothetical protein EZJ19_09500 [Parasulfuritortus cantonensis]